jgi:N-acylglucosamine-6-phosphate 2-epimerase
MLFGQVLQEEGQQWLCKSLPVGYTKETVGKTLYENDFQVLKEMIAKVKVPIIAEGNVLTPEMAKRCLELGAHAVVVGGAITRPQTIARRFVEAMG